MTIGSALVARVASQGAVSKYSELTRDGRFRKQLAKEAVADTQFGRQWRSVRRWLAEEGTWEDLVELTAPARERLTVGLTEALKRRSPATLYRRHPPRPEEVAVVLTSAVANFLKHLDPSIGLAVHDFRVQGALQAIVAQLEEMSRIGLRGSDSAYETLPTGVGLHVTAVISADTRTGASLLDYLEGEPGPDRSSRVVLLSVHPTDWLEDLTSRGWIALGEYAGAYSDTKGAAWAFERAAATGSANRSRLMARASANHGEAGDLAEARRCAAAARDLDPQDDYAKAMDFIIEQDEEALADLIARTEYTDDLDLAAIAAQSMLRNGEDVAGIELLDRLVRDNPQRSGLLVLTARLVLGRAEKQSGTAREESLNRCYELARTARDVRRRWLGDSVEPVVLAAQSAAIRDSSADFICVTNLPPAGEAIDREADSTEVLGLLATYHSQHEDWELAEAAIARLPEGFIRDLAQADLFLHRRANEPAQQLLLRAWSEADSVERQRYVQTQLALTGSWPLPGAEDLAADPKRGAWILALAERYSGHVDAAIHRSRQHRADDPRCGRLLADMLLREKDSLDAAVEVLAECAGAHRLADPLVTAARLLANQGRFTDAERLAESAFLHDATASDRVQLFEVMGAAAEDRGAWSDAESRCRSILDIEPSHQTARSLLVACLWNQRRKQEAWAELTRSGTPDAPSASDAVARILLAIDFAPGAESLCRALALQARFPDDEDVHAAFVFAAIKHLGEPTPLEVAEQARRVADEFFLRYPDSPRVWKIHVGDSPEELLDAIRPVLEAGALTARSVWRQIMGSKTPYGLAATVLGRHYAETLIGRAGGCWPISSPQADESAQEVRAASEALGGTIVCDTSTLNVLRFIPKSVDVLLGSFASVAYPTSALHDLRATLETLESAGSTYLGWDIAEGVPLVHNVEQAELAEHLGAVRSMLQVAAAFATPEHETLRNVAGDLELTPDHLPWLSPLDYAMEHGLTLYSDDLVVRRMAHSEGVPSFGTIALATACEDPKIAALLTTLGAHHFVDLPDWSQRFDQLVADPNDLASLEQARLLMMRPAFWTDAQEALRRLQVVLAADPKPEPAAAWLQSAIIGSCLQSDALFAIRRSSQLLALAVTATEATSTALSVLSTAARNAAEMLDLSDPTVTALQILHRAALAIVPSEQAAQQIALLAADLPADILGTLTAYLVTPSS